MDSFILNNTTRLIFGAGVLDKIGETIKEFGSHKVLLHCDGGDVLEKTGVLDRARFSLNKAGLKFVELGGVVPNPKLEKAKEGIALCKNESIDFIIALGGGSTIDSAKCIALGAVYDGDVWDFW